MKGFSLLWLEETGLDWGDWMDASGVSPSTLGKGGNRRHQELPAPRTCP